MEVIEQACKFILCVLLTQLGKTFTAINRITTEINQDDELGKSIHIVFTMNTLLNNTQFAKRLQTIEATYGKGSVCVFASKYSGKYIHVTNRTELQGLCADKMTCPRVVVMCSNSRRYDDGVKFIDFIDKNIINNISRAFAYYDELHAYITDSLRSQIEEIHSLEIVKGIIALTASPDKIWQPSGFWSNLRLIQLDHFNDTNYAGYKDMVFNCMDDFFAHPYVRPKRFDFDTLDSQTVGFIEHVLKKHPDILKENTRTFIPAHIRRSGHNTVRDLVFKTNSNCVVIVINGYEKTLQYKDHLGTTKTLPLISEDEEVCETITRLVVKHGLQTRPLVYTGFLCLGMGQTLTHKTLGSFTSALFGHLDLTNDEIYQLFGRITGRTKDWGEKYTQTQVYCPTIIMYRCNVMEECARNMAKEHNGDVVTQDDYRDPMSKMGEAGDVTISNIRVTKTKRVTPPEDPLSNHKVDLSLFRVIKGTTHKETLALAQEIFNKKILKRNFQQPKHTDEMGRHQTSLNKTHATHTVLEAIKKIGGGWGGGGALRAYYPVYLNLEDLNSLCCVIPIITTGDKKYTPEQLKALDDYKEKHPRNFIEIPQRGPLPTA